VHASGTTTGADGIAWLYVGDGRDAPSLGLATDGRVAALNGLTIPVVESASATLPVLGGTGSPENKVTAPIGATYLRSDGGTGSTFYVKESGTGATGWVAK